MNHVKRIEICNENKCKAGQYIIASAALYAYLWYDFEVEDLRRTKRNPRKNLKQYQVWSQNYPLLPRTLDDEEEELGRDQVTRDLQQE